MTPETLLQQLISGQKKDVKAATEFICAFSKTSPEHPFTLQEKIETLSSCGSAPPSTLETLVTANLFSNEDSIREACIHHLKKNLSRGPRLKALTLMVEANDEDTLKLAIALAKEWAARPYGEAIQDLIDHRDTNIALAAVECLTHISVSAWEKNLTKDFADRQDVMRESISKHLAMHSEYHASESICKTFLSDPLASVRNQGLRCVAHQIHKKWSSILTDHLQHAAESDEQSETLKLLGLTKNSRVIGTIVDFILTCEDQGPRWAAIQALENFSSRDRIKAYRQMIDERSSEHLPSLLELVANCDGETAYDLLKKILDQTSDPSLRSLIAGAMGACGNSAAKEDLLQMLNGDVSEAYAAAAALKNLAKDGVIGDFEVYLQRSDINVVVHQIMLQHITELSNSIAIPDSLRELIESFLEHENDNMRYLSIVALGALGHEASLKPLLKIYGAEWAELFQGDLNRAFKQCCGGRMTPLLDMMQNCEKPTFEKLKGIAIEHPMILSDQDLDTLSHHKVFLNWAWDVDCLPCVKVTHKKDPSFIWRQFSRYNLSDRLCCFLARGFVEADPRSHELLEPQILISCFNRFESEQPLLLLGKVMSQFPRVEFIAPLVQFSEDTNPELEMIFKSYVRRIVMGMSSLPS